LTYNWGRKKKKKFRPVFSPPPKNENGGGEEVMWGWADCIEEKTNKKRKDKGARGQTRRGGNACPLVGGSSKKGFNISQLDGPRRIGNRREWEKRGPARDLW